MVDLIAVGVLLGGASVYLVRRAVSRRAPDAVVDDQSCGCGTPGKSGCKS